MSAARAPVPRPGPQGRRRPAAGVAPDKRRLILDAAVRVFARQGFHACRVSDIADEAGVAYGLVYHYFASKDEVLNTLFLERWNVMLEHIREVDSKPLPVREKLGAIATFIIDSYRHDPDLMKVIIVEVTRAATRWATTPESALRPASRPDHIRRLTTSFSITAAVYLAAPLRAGWPAPAPPSRARRPTWPPCSSPPQTVSTTSHLARSNSSAPWGSSPKIQPVSSCSIVP